MTKLNLIVVVTLLFRGFYVHAQAPVELAPQLHKTMVQQLLKTTNHSKNVKKQTRALSYRVIGQSTVDNNMLGYTDSVNLSYGLNGTSQYDFNMLLYAYNYPYSVTPMFNNYLGIFTKPQVLHKSFNHWTVNPNTLVYGFYEKRQSSYDSEYNLVADTSWLADSLINPNTIGENTFDLMNNVEKSYKSNYVGGMVDSAFKQFFSYNSSNQLIKDSTYEFDGSTWHLVSKTFYSYDGSGNLVLINNFGNNSDPTFLLPLVNLVKYTNTYDGSNRLLTVHSDYFDGTSLIPYVKDTFAYTGSSDFHTNWKQYQYDPINVVWMPQLNMTKYLNGSGMPDSIMVDQYNSILEIWTRNYKYILTYDANDNPKQLHQYIYNFTSFPTMPDFTTTYYYESFTNTTAVNDVVISSNDVLMYPNPASSVLYVTLEAKNRSEKVYFNIYDAFGKRVDSHQLLEGINTIDVIRYVKGFYIATVTYEGQIKHSQKLIFK